MPLFSIITPTLGNRRFLEEALDSVCTQACPEFSSEHLLVTSPGCPSMPTVTDPDLSSRVIESASVGPVAAFNAGLMQAEGDLIGCLSDDDIYSPGALLAVKQIFDQYPNVDLIMGGLQQIDEDSVSYRKSTPKPISQRRVFGKCEGYQPGLFFRRTLLDEVGLLDPSLEYHFWYDFVVRCYLKGHDFHRTQQCLAGKRRHRGNRQYGVTDVDVRIAKSIEWAEVLVRRSGELPAKVALDVGHYKAIGNGVDPLKPGYDAEVLGNARELSKDLQSAMQGTRGSDKQTWGDRTFGMRLRARHAQVQGLLALKYPRALTRYLPEPVGNGLRGFFRSRLFQLKQYAPRTPQLSVPQPGQPSSDRLSIGVVTPNYNTADYLERTIQSVIDQDFDALQYVVQDGGSNDGSVEIARKYGDRLHHWDSRPDNGQTHAINRGASHLDTDVMAYLNSDDVLLPGSLSFVSEYFRCHPEVDVIYGHRLIIDGDDQEIGRWILPKHDDHAIMFADYIPQETMFWRRSAWEAVGESLDESFQFAMDWDLILRFRAAGMRFERVPRFLGAFRVIETQKTQVLLDTLGTTEMNRLRRRELGHIPTSREMRRAIRPYRLRQWVQHHTHSLFESSVS